jgi:hypothetical protein
VALPICWQPTQVLTFHEGLCPTNKYWSSINAWTHVTALSPSM